MTIGLYVSSALTERLFREQLEPLYQGLSFSTRESLEAAFAEETVAALLWETENHFWVQVGAAQTPFSKPLRLQSILQLLSDALSQRGHKIGPYLFDPQKRLLKRGGATSQTITLREKENEILLYLLNAPERRASRQKLLTHIWGVQPGMETRTLETHVYQLRQKIRGALQGESDILINTEDGYQLLANA